MSKLIVSLTFDDGLECHLDMVIPILEQHGMLGTFYVNLNAPSLINRMLGWKNIAVKGHELGNHTIFHPALSKYEYITEGRALENYTSDRMRIELEAANQILSGLDAQKERTFACPSNNSILGQPGVIKKLLQQTGMDKNRISGWFYKHSSLDFFSTEQDYSYLMPDLFVATRGGEFGARDLKVDESDRYSVPCISGDGLNAEQLVDVVKQFKVQGNWLVLMFHGIETGHSLVCKKTDFEALIEMLDSDMDVQVLPFIQAAKLL